MDGTPRLSSDHSSAASCSKLFLRLRNNPMSAQNATVAICTNRRRSFVVLMNKRALIALVAASALAGCQQKKAAPTTVGTVKIDRRNITVDATATGAVEPIAIVEVKSKAGGQITKMPVETGTEVKTGALLVQIDTRDVTNQY